MVALHRVQLQGRLPPTFHDEGLRAALEVRRQVPGTAVLVVSQYVEPTYAAELLADRGGGIGYLLKDRVMHVADFLEAVRRVAAGGTALDPDVVAQLFSRRRQDGPLERLTPREREVLSLMAEGRSNAGIAESLVLTVGAVEKHVQSILSKLDLPQSTTDHRRVLAVLADRGLEAALASLASSTPLRVELSVDVSPRPAPAVESAAYFVAAESLANAAKHARAKRVEIKIARHGDMIELHVRDDGQGGANPEGSGLRGLRRRVEALDGTLSVISPRGGPTTIRAQLPCE